MRTIYEKIEEKGKAEVDKILSSAKEEAKKIKEDLINAETKTQGNRLARITSETNRELSHKERLVDLEKRQSLLTSKQRILDEVFSDVLDKIKDLKDKELLNFVKNLLTDKGLNGTETIYVSANEYNKYLKALSSNKKAKLVDLDILNKELKTNYKLSNEDINLKYGFLVEGTDFDLNFSYDEILNSYRKNNEKKISEQLFN